MAATVQVKQAADEGLEFSVATARPGPRSRRLALAVVIALLVAYAAVAPYATVPLPRIDSFIPTVFAILFLSDVVTAVLIYGQFSATGSRALLVLAGSFLFSALIAVGHVLTFPGVFSPTGLLGAGPQTAAWLNVLWRLGLTAPMVLYAVQRSGQQANNGPQPTPSSAIAWSVTIVVVAALALIALVTTGHGLLPPVLADGQMLPLAHYANGVIAFTNAIALLLLLACTRGRSVLDLWLIVAVFSMLVESVVITFFIQARFSLGFYAVRIIGLPVSNAVLIVLLWETMRIYAALSISIRDLQRERANRLTSAEAVLAAVAHQIRQPLTNINLLAFAGQGLLDRASPDVSAVKTHLGEIEEDAFRVSQVFDGFLSFFRGGKQEKQAVDVNSLVLEATRLLRRDLHEHQSTIDADLAPSLPSVHGHAGHLREVMLNLIQNSIEAMASTTHKARVITISTARLGPDAVRISLQDAGPGIDPKALTSIFDPFVTTKKTGTGLGLAICKMIVEQHGGELTAASGENGGARFEITLPAGPAPVGAGAADETEQPYPVG